MGPVARAGHAMVSRPRHAAARSPVRSLSLADVDGHYSAQPLEAKLTVDATRPMDDIRAAVFSIVALQQLYNEDGGHGEDLFLALIRGTGSTAAARR